ncbi:MAG: hypothetical protein HRT91_02445 [Piscirickettsiaceae bacterium]|nr:hypothetical protein [Piscirickettsiaceae bacterium]
MIQVRINDADIFRLLLGFEEVVLTSITFKVYFIMMKAKSNGDGVFNALSFRSVIVRFIINYSFLQGIRVGMGMKSKINTFLRN